MPYSLDELAKDIKGILKDHGIQVGSDKVCYYVQKALMDQIPTQNTDEDIARWAFSYGARMTTDENGSPSILSSEPNSFSQSIYCDTRFCQDTELKTQNVTKKP